MSELEKKALEAKEAAEELDDEKLEDVAGGVKLDSVAKAGNDPFKKD